MAKTAGKTPIEDSLLLKKGVQQYNMTSGQMVSYLKPMQCTSLKYTSNSHDTFVVLPTGYGKSLIYELLPYVVQGSIVLCVCPLNAIIEQQQTKLNMKKEVALNIKHINIKHDFLKTKYIFGHPEDFASSDIFGHEAMESFSVIYLVIDEAHCVLDWGAEFQPAFSKIGDMLAFFNATIIAMSATVTADKREEISRILKMKNPKIVSCSPILNDNIRLIVRKRPACSSDYSVEMTYERVFKIYLLELLRKGEDFDTTVIYTKLKWCSYGISLAHRILGDHMYSGTHIPENLRVVQFHSPQTNETNSHILASLEKGTSVKIIFATVALGMGADLKRIRRVVHVGTPCSIEEYVQEIGRCGRDGTEATATMFYNNTDIGVRNVHEAVKDFINTSKCRREILSAHFQSDYICRASRCCDVCMSVSHDNLQVATETELFMLRCMIEQYLKSHPTIAFSHVKMQNIIDMLDTVDSANDIRIITDVESDVARDIFEMFSFILGSRK